LGSEEGILMDKSYEEMVSELEEYYECAGFAGYYERVLKGRTPEEITAMYQEMIQFEEQDCDEWERRPEDE
jgi:hypothetical protein